MDIIITPTTTTTLTSTEITEITVLMATESSITLNIITTKDMTITPHMASHALCQAARRRVTMESIANTATDTNTPTPTPTPTIATQTPFTARRLRI
jgi:hypothetical protein